MQELTSPALQYFLDLLGIFGGALSGAYLSVRKDFNLFGTLVLAEAAGLGGSLIRDLILDVPPIAFTDPGYPLAPLAAAYIAYRGRALQQQPYVFEVLDAVGLGLFSVTGTIKGLVNDMNVVPSTALGVISAMGGGILAHMMARELPPLLCWDSDLYALPSITGAGATAALHLTGTLTITTATCAALAAFTFRLLAVHFHWRPTRSAAWRTSQTPLFLATDAAVPQTRPSHTDFANAMRLRSVPHARGRRRRQGRPTGSADTTVPQLPRSGPAQTWGSVEPPLFVTGPSRPATPARARTAKRRHAK
jgi:uncharacterized membrane protein YeiH